MAGIAGCGSEPSDAPSHRPPPALEAAAAAPGTTNVLSILVTARADFADSASVRYGAPGEPLDLATPAVQPEDGLVEIPVLGLSASTDYELRMVAGGEGGVTWSEPLRVTTGPLPVDLPRFRAGGPSPSPGYVVFAAGTYGLAIDEAGRVAWYVRFAGPSLNFQAQPNGRYVARPTTLDTSDVEPVVEFDALGEVTRELHCARGLRPRFHDVLVEPNGGSWLMCDETRIMDLTGVGGLPEATVTGP